MENTIQRSRRHGTCTMNTRPFAVERTIPEATADIAARLKTGQTNCALGDMDVGTAGRLSMLLLPAQELATLNQHGFTVGARLQRTTDGFILENGWTAQLSDTAQRSVFVEIETPSV